MKLIKYWRVKLFNTALIVGGGGTLLYEGYAKEKPILKIGHESTMELLVTPDGVETKTFRTHGIDIMTCTPLYETEEQPGVYEEGGDYSTENVKARRESFEAAARPLIKWLAENVHPHHSVIVDSTHAELLEGQQVVSTEEYLRG